MRAKSRGGRACISKLPLPTPTSTSSLHFPNLNLNEENAKNNGDNIASAFRDKETDNLIEMSGGLGPSRDFMEMDILQGESCIVCDRGGGNVLVCSGTGCPIALHEHCMQSGLKYDDVGNFYCPYCWYKCEVLRTRELRKAAMEAKKALSCFIDSNMASSDKGKENGARDKGKDLNVSPPIGEKKYGASEDRIDDDQVESQFVEEEDGEENGGNNAKLADYSDERETAVEHQREPLCDDNNLKKTPWVESPLNTLDKEGPSKDNVSESHEVEVLEDGVKIQVEDSGQVDDGGNERIVEDPQQTEPCRVSGEQEENAADVEDPQQTEPCRVSGEQEENAADCLLHLAKQVESDPVKLKQGRRENGEKKHPETSGTEMSDSDADTILMHQRRVLRRSKRKAPQNVDLSKKLSSPLSTSPKNIAKTHSQKVIASKKPRRQEAAAKKFTNMTFSNEKRKRLNWTAEEEEMLKEGVQKFSTEVNKNLPWRKILEFGHHVFDPTRNPADLKDKWRNIMAKESSTIKRS